MRNYNIALTWYGLLDLCHVDAIREADGHAMMDMWGMDMVTHFWRGAKGDHNNYMIITHLLLAGTLHIRPLSILPPSKPK